MFTFLIAVALWPLSLGLLGAAALVGLFLVVVGYFFEDDWYFKGFVALGIVGAFLWFRGGFEHLNWKLGALYAGGYLVTGVLWSLYKWVIFVRDLKKDVQELIATKNHQIFRSNPDPKGTNLKYVGWTDLTKEEKGNKLRDRIQMSKYAAFLDLDKVRDDFNVTPHLSTWTNKAKIVSWIVYWPLSVANYVFGRLLKDIIDFVIENLKGVYNMIAASIMKGLEI